MPVTDFRAGADTSQFVTNWVKETNWGQVPSPTPTLNTARITSNTLTLAKTTQRSNEISAGRKIKNRILTAFEVGGELGFELSLDGPGQNGFADLLDGALFGVWSTPVAIGPVAIDASAVDNSFNDPLAAGTMFQNVAVGQWVKSAAFTDPSNNGVFRVSSKPSADKIIVDATLVTEAGGGDETVTSSALLRDGTTAHSYVIENRYDGITTPQHVAFLGCMIQQLSLAFETDAVVTGSFNLLGKTMNDASASSVGDGSPNAATSQEVTNTVTDVGFIREGGATPAAFIRALTLQLDNGLRLQRAIHGGPEAVGIGLGDADVTGRLTGFFEDGALIQTYKQHAATQLDWRVTDRDGRILVLTIPRVRLSSYGAPVNGPNQDVEQQFDFEAELEPVTNTTLQLDYFAN